MPVGPMNSAPRITVWLLLFGHFGQACAAKSNSVHSALTSDEGGESPPLLPPASRSEGTLDATPASGDAGTSTSLASSDDTSHVDAGGIDSSGSPEVDSTEPSLSGCDSLPVCVDKILRIRAKPCDWRSSLFTSTPFYVPKNACVSITPTNTPKNVWNIGMGPVGPYGEPAECECLVHDLTPLATDGGVQPVRRGLLGALVARIGAKGTPFIVGRTTAARVNSPGILFFASNDNVAPCKDGLRGSCFDDNQGQLEVHVVVKADRCSLEGIIFSPREPPDPNGANP